MEKKEEDFPKLTDEMMIKIRDEVFADLDAGGDGCGNNRITNTGEFEINDFEVDEETVEIAKQVTSIKDYSPKSQSSFEINDFEVDEETVEIAKQVVGML